MEGLRKEQFGGEGSGLERAILIGAGERVYLGELRRLAETLGLSVLGEMEQARRDGSGYLGSGKRKELSELLREVGAGVVVADDELTSSQARTLERDIDAPVIDRTELIIRIFDEHASDAAAKMQVELAELEYVLPRIRGMWQHLERIGGGRILARGPGEQQLEYDRREIRVRMEKLKERIETARASREVRRSRRRKGKMPVVALVGYTNAGKTTILNALSDAGRSTRDRLFETLQTTTRTVSYDGNGHQVPDFSLTDTVGFIRKLPTQLVESFASTLEAAEDADILVVCMDASSKDIDEELKVINDTLGDMTNDKHIIHAYNKRDLIRSEDQDRISNKDERAVFCGMRTGYTQLLDEIYEKIASDRRVLDLLIPHERHDEVAKLYGTAEIISREEHEDGVRMEVIVPIELARDLEPYKAPQNQPEPQER